MIKKHKCIKCQKEYFECELQPTGTTAVPNKNPELGGRIDYIFYNYICKGCQEKEKEKDGSGQ